MTFGVKNIQAGYGKDIILKSLSCEFASGRFHALIGPNGSGKTTLLKTLARLIKPQDGDIIGLSKTLPLSQNIAYLSQSRQAHPQMRVYDIVALGRLPYRRPYKPLQSTDKTAIERAMQRADILDMRDATFATLSGGQQARVLLARALCVEASILLVDEPVASLDPYYQLSILEVLKQEAASSTTVIAALHDLSLVKQFADCVYVIEQGHIRTQGQTDTALSPEILESVFRIKDADGQRYAL